MGETDAPEEVQRVLEMLRRGDEGAGTAAYCLDTQVYAAGLPFFCEFFASYDPRVSAGRKGAEPVDINIVSGSVADLLPRCHVVMVLL